MRPFILGICAAFFFAFTFVLNHAMEFAGGSWIFSASLRYIFMVPFLLGIVIARKNLRPLLNQMRQKPGTWLLWSFVGFGMFYAPLCLASAYSPGWLIAGTWQLTIVSGLLLGPFFYEKVQTKTGVLITRGRIPMKGLILSLIILLGVLLMQFEHTKQISLGKLALGILPVIIASFAYPLGNRKMMDVTEGRLDAYQRVLGMTLASLPFWLLLSLFGFIREGLPSKEQTFQSLLVALCSGVIATVLFFKATDLVRGNMQGLASVEATQSLEVLFALFGELAFLAVPMPSLLSWFGILVVILGIILHSFVSHKKESEGRKQAVSA